MINKTVLLQKLSETMIILIKTKAQNIKIQLLTEKTNKKSLLKLIKFSLEFQKALKKTQ